MAFNSKFELEKEKISILQRDSESLEIKLVRNSTDLKSMSEANKNLVIEIRSINSLLDEVNRHKEIMLMELNYYKSELDIT